MTDTVVTFDFDTNQLLLYLVVSWHGLDFKTLTKIFIVDSSSATGGENTLPYLTINKLLAILFQVGGCIGEKDNW